MERLSCSLSCKDVRNPIKLSCRCSKERYLMRQKYLRSYPLMTTKEKGKLGGDAVNKAKKWLTEMKYECRSDGRENKRKAWRQRLPEAKKSFSSHVESCLRSLISSMAKMEVPKTIGFGN